MSTDTLRKQIHGYIDKADDRFISLIHAMMLADLDEKQPELSEEQLIVLEERLEEYYKNPSAGSSMDEVFKRLTTRNNA